ncbi:MAG: hypothetical protein ACRDTA_13985 [Pseudonocardiaceae bacterium]
MTLALTDRDDDGACPGCDTTSGVQLTSSTSPAVQSGSCTVCGTSWAVTCVNPHLAYFERLAATVEEIGRQRWILRQVVQLAHDLPELTDVELRDRLLALAERAVPPVSRSR